MTQIIKIRRNGTSATAVPTALAEGELAAALAADPVRMWIGTQSGVKELFAGAAVEDAEDDAVYGRSNGDWEPIPIVSATPPTDPAPNSFWFNTTDGTLQFLFDDGDSVQWVQVGPQIGPQGPQGLPGIQGPVGGTFPDAPVDGAHLRRNGAWVPMTHANVNLTAQIALGLNVWAEALTLDVGTVGTWLVLGSALFHNPSAAFFCHVRLWDGNTVIASAESTQNTGWTIQLSPSGVITNPAGPLRLSTATANAGTVVRFNTLHMSSITPVTYLTAVRIG